MFILDEEFSRKYIKGLEFTHIGKPFGIFRVRVFFLVLDRGKGSESFHSLTPFSPIPLSV